MPEIPRSVEEKLLAAKKWYDRRVQLERAIRAHNGVGSAQRNQEDRDEFDREAGALLMEIVEEIEDTVGWAR
jgi:hypothetical protein